MYRRLFGFLFSLILLIPVLFACSNAVNKAEMDSLFGKGRSAYLKRDFKAAEELFSLCVKKDPSHIASRVMLAKSCYFQGKQEEAVASFKGLLAKDKNNVTALTWLARIEGIEQGKPERGLSYCERALRSDVDNFLAHFYRAMILDESGAVKEAILSYSSALELENIVYLAHYKLGRLYEEKGLKEKAIDEFREVLKYSPGGDLEKEIIERIRKHVSK